MDPYALTRRGGERGINAADVEDHRGDGVHAASNPRPYDDLWSLDDLDGEGEVEDQTMADNHMRQNDEPSDLCCI